MMDVNMSEFLNGFMTAWNAHDVQAVAAHYAPDYEEIDVARARPEVGPDNVRRTILYYLRAFPDFKLTLDDVIVNGERVAMYWTWTGTHRGTFMNIPATGRNVMVRGTSLVDLENGQIRRAVRIWDLAGLLRSIGLLPELSA
jgi:steroid delta-isomerase-like uncharacterized protein